MGDRILDHDVALAYVLDRQPDLLPSFRALYPLQRKVGHAVALTSRFRRFQLGRPSRVLLPGLIGALF